MKPKKKANNKTQNAKAGPAPEWWEKSGYERIVVHTTTRDGRRAYHVEVIDRTGGTNIVVGTMAVILGNNGGLMDDKAMKAAREVVAFPELLNYVCGLEFIDRRSSIENTEIKLVRKVAPEQHTAPEQPTVDHWWESEDVFLDAVLLQDDRPPSQMTYAVEIYGRHRRQRQAPKLGTLCIVRAHDGMPVDTLAWDIACEIAVDPLCFPAMLSRHPDLITDCRETLPKFAPGGELPEKDWPLLDDANLMKKLAEPHKDDSEAAQFFSYADGKLPELHCIPFGDMDPTIDDVRSVLRRFQDAPIRLQNLIMAGWRYVPPSDRLTKASDFTRADICVVTGLEIRTSPAQIGYVAQRAELLCSQTGSHVFFPVGMTKEDALASLAKAVEIVGAHWDRMIVEDHIFIPNDDVLGG